MTCDAIPDPQPHPYSQNPHFLVRMVPCETPEVPSHFLPPARAGEEPPWNPLSESHSELVSPPPQGQHWPRWVHQQSVRSKKGPAWIASLPGASPATVPLGLGRHGLHARANVAGPTHLRFHSLLSPLFEWGVVCGVISPSGGQQTGVPLAGTHPKDHN